MKGQPFAEADSLISWDEPEAAFQLPAHGSKHELASVSANPTLAEAVLCRNRMTHQQSEQLSNSSSVSPSAYSNTSWAAAQSSSAEGTELAPQNCVANLYHRHSVGQLQTGSSGQQQSGQTPEQWHYAHEQNRSRGGGPGQEMPLGLDLLQELSQQQRMYKQSDAMDQQAVSDQSSGSSTPERVAFVSQVKAKQPPADISRI